MLRCESRYSFKSKFLTRCTDRITDGKDARIEYTNNVTGICLVYYVTGLCHHLLRLKKSHLLFALYMVNFLRCIKFS